VHVVVSDLAHRLPESPYLDLLMLAAFPRSRDEQIRIACEFRDRDDHRFWVAQVDGVPLGACAIVEAAAASAVIRYLAVVEPHRRRGIGRCLIETAIERTRCERVELETGHEATGFYARCGFIVRCIGEKYPGTVRYVCTYTR